MSNEPYSIVIPMTLIVRAKKEDMITIRNNILAFGFSSRLSGVSIAVVLFIK